MLLKLLILIQLNLTVVQKHLILVHLELQLMIKHLHIQHSLKQQVLNLLDLVLFLMMEHLVNKIYSLI